MSTLLVFVYFLFVPYYLPVLVAFFAVKRRGRGFHGSDMLPILIPYVAYWAMMFDRDRQGWNIQPPLWIAGIAVALCMPSRLALWAKPWPWAVVITLIGVVAAYYGYMTTPWEGASFSF